MLPESPLPRPSRRPLVAPSLEERAAAFAGPSSKGAFSPRKAPAVDPAAKSRSVAIQPTLAPAARPGPRAAPAQQQASRGITPQGSVILGIDPGTRVVGWGAIELTARGPRLLAAGVLKAGDGELAGRLGLIRRELDRLIATWRPMAMAVEEAFAHKNIQSALRIGEGRGVVLSCAAAAGVSVHQYSPASAKKALVGNGAAHKSQVAAMVARRLELAKVPEPLDATDALALALTHLDRSLGLQVSSAAGRVRRTKGPRRGRA